MRYKIVTISLLIILCGLSILGVFWVGSVDHDQIHSCPISAMSEDCPVPVNGVILALHHISGIKLLSLAVPNSRTIFQIFVTILATFLLILIASKNEYNDICNRLHNVYKRTYTLWQTELNSLKENILFWIGLHNKKELPSLHWAYARPTLI